MSIDENNNKTIDYVLVYQENAEDKNGKKLRKFFKLAMKAEGLQIKEEKVENYVFIKIHCPFDRLCEEAESLKIEFPLLELNWIVSEIKIKKDSRQSFLRTNKMKNLFGMSEESTPVTVPFLKDCQDWFINEDQKDAFFLPSMRCLLVHNILINIDIAKKTNLSNSTYTEKQGLLYMQLKNIYVDSFVLHDPSVQESINLLSSRSSVIDFDEEANNYQNNPSIGKDTRLELDNRWTKCFNRQPLDLIRNYFGETITFYFAWIGTLISSLFIPAILGVAVFIYGVVTRLIHGEDIILKNGTVIRDNKTGFLYGLDVIKSSSDNHYTPFFAFIICLWGTVFLEIWKRKQATLAHRWHVENFDMVEQERPQFYGTELYRDPFIGEIKSYYPFRKRFCKYLFSIFVLVIMVFVVFISMTSVILYRIYTNVTICKEDTKCNFFHGTVITAMLNTASIMILGRLYNFLAIKLTDWENHPTQSIYNDALIIKLFAFQFANTYTSLFYIAFFRKDLGENGIFGMGKEYQDDCGDLDQDNCMSLLSFQILVLMIMKPFPKFATDIIFPCLLKLYRIGLKKGIKDNLKQHYLLREMLKPVDENFRLEEFSEKVIAYGYIMLFAASFPLAPLLALGFIAIDLRIDAKRLLWWNRRPIPYRDNDIGIWFNILHFINICGTISNACLIAFTSKFGRKFPLNKQLIIVLIFEHFVFTAKFLLDIAIPDIPENVILDRKRDRFVVAHFMSVVASSRGTLDWTKSLLVHHRPKSYRNKAEEIFETE